MKSVKFRRPSNVAGPFASASSLAMSSVHLMCCRAKVRLKGITPVIVVSA